MKKMIQDRLTRYGSRLRFPKLLALTVTLFLVDLLVPDFIPFVDEILLGLVSMIFAMMKRKE